MADDWAVVWYVTERAVVALVVFAAAVFLYLHWSGRLAKWRDRKRPDVRVSDLVRKKESSPPNDDCCR